MSDFIKQCIEYLKDKENVIGFSEKLRPKIVNGKEVEDIKVIRVYVSKKVEEAKLKAKDIVPKVMCNSETDVIEIGEVKAFVDRTSKIRPVELDVSVGNIVITAGSLGMKYVTKEGNSLGLPAGKVLLGSNAHVLTDNDPSKEIDGIKEKRIAQPGVVHDAMWFNNLVGDYVWHQVIYPKEYISECEVSKAISKFLNKVSKFLHRRTTFKAIVEDRSNYVDFALYEPTVEHLSKVVGDFIKPEDKFVGHLFAGSEIVGVVFGLDKILPYGIEPLVNYSTERLKIGDIVKGASFWGDYETEVVDDSAVITVNYGNFLATFEDIILLKNSNVIRGGWSGSSWFLKGI